MKIPTMFRELLVNTHYTRTQTYTVLHKYERQGTDIMGYL